MSVKMAYFCFLLFALVFFCGCTFGNGLKIAGDIPGLACVQSYGHFTGVNCIWLEVMLLLLRAL